MSTPIEYGTYEQGKVRLEQGDFGTYLIVNCATSEDILVQSDTDFPSLAMDFGLPRTILNCSSLSKRFSQAIEKAIDYLDDNIGTTIDDPGYFGE
jgi:predicted nuclease of predicted toxin-antitoxin system